MGIGAWIWTTPPLVTKANLVAYVREMKGIGLQHAVIKILDGTRNYNGDSLRPLFDQFHEEGMHAWAWGYEYPTPGDLGALASRAAALGADGVVIDAEKEWDGEAGLDYESEVRAAFKGPVYLSSYYSKDVHREFPWDDFRWVDGYMPQVYATQPSVAALLEESRKSFAPAPWIPTGLADSQIGSLQQTQDFLASCVANGWTANLWVWEHMTLAMKAAVQAAASSFPA